MVLFAKRHTFQYSKWFEPRSISSSYSVIVRVSVVLERTVVGDWRFDNWAEVTFRGKWIVFVSRWCYKSGPLNVIGQYSHDGIGWKTRVVCHQSSIVSQIGRFLVRVLLSRSVKSPFVVFVSVMDKSYKRLKTCLIKHRSNYGYKLLSTRGTHARAKHIW